MRDDVGEHSRLGVPRHDDAAATGVAGGEVPGDDVVVVHPEVIGDQEPAAPVELGDVVVRLRVRGPVEVHAHVPVVDQEVVAHLDVVAVRDEDAVEARADDHETGDDDLLGVQDDDAAAARQAGNDRLLSRRVDQRVPALKWSAPDKCFIAAPICT